MVTEYYNNNLNKRDISYYRSLTKHGYSHKDAFNQVKAVKKDLEKEKLLKIKLKNDKEFSDVELDFLESFNDNNQKILYRWIK